MTNEATMPVRNAGPRPLPETARESWTMNGSRGAAHAAGAHEAGMREASSGPSRRFEDSMTQAMRRAQSKPANETREQGEREASGNQTETEAAASGSEAPERPQEMQPPSGAPTVVPTGDHPQAAAVLDEAPVATADSTPAAGSDSSAIVIDAGTDPAAAPSMAQSASAEAPLPSIERGATSTMRSPGANETVESVPSAPSDASPTEGLQPSAADASKLTADSQSRPPGADAPSTRSTADFAAQLAHARGAPATNAPQSAGIAGESTSAANPAHLHRTDVSTSVGDAMFPGRFAAEVALLGTAGIERAEIRLHPRELGPVRVELSMNGESARIAFSAVQPETRQAIEQSLPVLKDLLTERGLMLGEASVSDGHAGHGSSDSEAASSDADLERSTAAVASDRSFAADARRTPNRRTLLDVYA